MTPTLDRFDQHSIDAFRFSMLTYNPAPPMPCWWPRSPAKVETVFVWRVSWRVRLQWWLEDFWRHTIKREVRFTEARWISRAEIDWGLEEFEPPAIDSRAWTGLYR